MTTKNDLAANTLVQVFITVQPCNHLQKTVAPMTAAKHLLRVAGVCFSLSLLSGCETEDYSRSPQKQVYSGSQQEPVYPNTQLIPIPDNTPVEVVITSESCNHLQQTVITWPDGTKDTFQTPSAASPDSCDPSFDAAHPTVITYGIRTGPNAYNAKGEGKKGGNAKVEVFDFLKAGDPMDPTWTRKQAADKRVESEGHENLIRVDWNDTIVSFSW